MNKGELESLLHWLSPRDEAAGERYEALRNVLIRLFEMRGLGHCAVELTDRTMDTVATKLAKGEALGDNPRAYLHGVARNVMKDAWKQRVCESLSETHDTDARQDRKDPRDTRTYWEQWSREQEVLQNKEALLRCLDECLRQLPAESRVLVLRYYEGEKRSKIINRQRLADELQVTPNSLAIRVLRIRSKLEECTRTCGERERCWPSGS